MAKSQPNVLVIITDQHSKHVLGAYGNNIVRTPNLDAFAESGLRFDSAYCPAPLCVPSRMSFLTSRRPSGNQVYHNQSILSSDIPTWATALSIAGYETSLIGRMHFQGPDQHHGFENRPIGEYSAAYPGSPLKGGPGFTVFPGSTTGQNRSSVEIAGRGIGPYQMLDERVTERACSFLMNPRSDERPFAAVVGYLLPHCPFVGEADLYDHYYDRIDIPAVEPDQPATITRFRSERGILEPELPEERIRVARAAYFAMCESIDRMIGQLLDALERSGEADNTIVVYTSDHGEMAGEHGCWWKSNFYEGSVGVPLIIRYPSVVSAGGSTTGVVNLTDLGPTFAELAGTEMGGIDGRSIRELLENPERIEAFDTTTAEFVERVSSIGPIATRMIRSGRYKYWRHYGPPDLPPALFDLDSDPDELRDLGTDSEFASLRRDLDARLLDGWNPTDAIQVSVRKEEGFVSLTQWAKTVKPPAPYAEPMPPPQFEELAERR